LVKRGKNGVHDAVEVAHDIVVADAKDPVSLGGDECTAMGIMRDCLIRSMGIAIDLDDETPSVAGEVGIVGPQLDLPAEMVAQRPDFSRGIPQPRFGRRHGLAEFSCALNAQTHPHP